MHTTIDRAGRIVVPKALRDGLGLSGGEDLEITVRDGAIVIEPRAARVTLAETPQGLVATPAEDLPPLTDDIVRATVERVRR